MKDKLTFNLWKDREKKGRLHSKVKDYHKQTAQSVENLRVQKAMSVKMSKISEFESNEKAKTRAMAKLRKLLKQKEILQTS